MKKAVAYWYKGDELRLVIPEDGQTVDEAMIEEAKKHGIDPSTMTKGEPPAKAKEEPKATATVIPVSAGNPAPGQAVLADGDKSTALDRALAEVKASAKPDSPPPAANKNENGFDWGASANALVEGMREGSEL